MEHKLREGQSVNRISQVHRVHHSVIRRVARELEDLETRTGNPDSPQAVVFLATIVDITVGT